MALFLNEKSFIQVLFPHLQSLAGNQYINPKLSLVLPQTCLCLKNDANRAKLLELICHIASIALNDNDYNLMKNIMQDMHLLYKVFCVGQLEEKMQYSLGISLQNSAGINQKQYPISIAFFNTKVAGAVFQTVQASVHEWRCFEASLDFLAKSIQYMSREAIREKYLPCLLDNMRD